MSSAGSSRRPRERLPKPQIRLPIGHPRRGRPHTYDPCFAPRARKLALLGMTDVEIAEFFGVQPSTLYRWRNEIPEFSEALLDGKAAADAEVATSLYNRACGMKVPAVKIFQGTPDGDPVVVPYQEHLPPDVGAAKLWLTNRQPGRWRERREIEVLGSLEHKLSLMSVEERRARLAELTRKAALVIEGEAHEVGQGNVEQD
jgi:hypothetical protein